MTHDDSSRTTSPKKADPRHRGERVLVQSLMDEVQAAAKGVVSDRHQQKASATPNKSPMDLTAAEKQVFNKYTYYGWQYGVPTAVTFFGVVFGGLRWAAYRRLVRARALPSSATYHARTSTHRQHYVTLDRPGPSSTAATTAAKRTTTAPTNNSPPPPPPASGRSSSQTPNDSFQIFADDITVQAQFMISAALSLFVGVVTCNLTTDRHRFHRDLSVLPLRPGPSVFCQRLCPALIRHSQYLRELPSMRPLYEQHMRRKQEETSTTDHVELSFQEHSDDDQQAVPQEPSPSVQAILQLKPMDLWEDPVTEDWESMIHLVQNCQRRLDFVVECRRRNHRVVDDGTGLVDVPEPGVPMFYHQSSSSSSNNRTSNSCTDN